MLTAVGPLEDVCGGVRGDRECERNHKSLSSRACVEERKKKREN